jgi:pimeloyl-ACP methyl ester carboxylesterase
MHEPPSDDRAVRLSPLRRLARGVRFAGCAVAAATTWPVCRFVRGPEHAPEDDAAARAAAARESLRHIRDDRRSRRGRLERPVLVLSGYHAPGVMGGNLARRLASLLGAPFDDFRMISYPHMGDLDRVAQAVHRVVRREFSNRQEFDVVGISMGGIISRMLAAEEYARERRLERLQLQRLFTMATPHQGAKIATHIHPDRAAVDMQIGSSRLAWLNTLPRDYELHCYAILNDFTVGAKQTALDPEHPIWVRGTPLFSHSLITEHPLVVLDVAARLANLPGVLDKSPAPSD